MICEGGLRYTLRGCLFMSESPMDLTDSVVRLDSERLGGGEV